MPHTAPALPRMRSWLFAPGDSERKMAKAADGEADIVLLDLEEQGSALAVVERLIEEETIEGERFRAAVEAWQAAHPELASAGLRETAVQPAPAAAVLAGS